MLIPHYLVGSQCVLQTAECNTLAEEGAGSASGPGASPPPLCPGICVVIGERANYLTYSELLQAEPHVRGSPV